MVQCTPPPCFNNGSYCNGNGVCTNGTCKCNPPAQGLSCITPTQPPAPPPVQPCFNSGFFCSGNGNCTNNTCKCIPAFGGPACNITIAPPPLTCANLTAVFNCSSCLAESSALRLPCAWCPNTTDPYLSLTSGSCVDESVCGNLSFYACNAPSIFVPAPCPDNCTNPNGICVNISFCEWINNQPGHVWKVKDSTTGKVKVYTCSAQNLNYSIAHNQSTLCACVSGKGGINCYAAGLSAGLVAGLAAGILALIICMALLGLAICGGGAYAASTALGAADMGGVAVNPLYEEAGDGGENPLYT